MSVDNSSITDSCLEESEGLGGSQQELFGRTSERAKLIKTYLKVVSRRSCEIVIVHGLSGSGKTSLVDVLREPVCISSGYFCSGKFFQNPRFQEPYSAVMAAFSDLCEQVIQADDFQDRKHAIVKSLGSDGRLLEKSITGLSSILDESVVEQAADTRNEVAMTRFAVACKNFLRAMSSRKHPIVLFIDDIQWMDNGSKHLIQGLLRDDELKNVLIILTYRDEEPDMVQGVLSDAIRSRATDIPISNLSPNDVFLLVSTVLSSASGGLRELSGLIANRTLGNPFYIISFLKTIEKEGLFAFDSASASWSFDVDEIQREVPVSDTLGDLLSRKIGKLPSNLRETLKVASLLGFRFREIILREVTSAFWYKTGHACIVGESSAAALSDQSQIDISISLALAVKEKMVEKTKDGGYQFLHDKIQAAFMAMIVDGERERLHKVIGETFLAQEGDESVYQAAVHLNQGFPLLVEGGDRVKLAVLNLQASKICRKKSAFDGAVSLLLKGLEVLDCEDKWGDANFDLSFEMTELLAKMYLVVGKFEACNATVGEALRRAKSVEMKIESLLIGIECRMANVELRETIVAAVETLPLLGVSVPRKVGVRHVLSKLARVQLRIRRMTDEDIINLAPMEDKKLSLAVKILVTVSLYCSFNGRYEERMRSFHMLLLAIELTLKHGFSSFSATAFAAFGLVQLLFGKVDRAYSLGVIAMQILEKLNCRDSQNVAIAVRHIALTHWKEPISVMREPFLDTMTSSIETGYMICAIHSMAYFNAMGIMVGENLQSLEEDHMRPAYTRMCRMRGQEGMIMWTQPSIQFVLNMRSEVVNWEDLLVLTGEIMDETQYLEEASSTHNISIHSVCLINKAMLAFNFGFYAEAESIFAKIAVISPKVSSFTFMAMGEQFYASMTNFILYRESRGRKHLKKARAYKKMLLTTQAVGSPSAASFLSLLEAEELASKRSQGAATIKATYDKAIGVMAEETWVHLEALANERAGFTMAELGKLQETESYFERSLWLYKHGWGSIAKYEWLKEMRSVCLKDLRRKAATNSEVLVGVTGMELTVRV